MTLRSDAGRCLLEESGLVSHETLARLDRFVTELISWQRRINLISPTTVDDIWQRHILDSVQLLALQPDAKVWLDLGSGGGLPGLVLACQLAERSDGSIIHLVESNMKKAAFLRHVAVGLGLPAIVHDRRIEDVVGGLIKIDVVTARALAPLDTLLAYTNQLLKSGTIGLFPKGRDVESELTHAKENWHFSFTLLPSRSDPQARIVQVESCAGPA